MPATLTYPGVYIEEVPSGVRAITGVATSIAAFVGYTRKGVPDKARTITSFAGFEREYGGLDRDSPVSYAVRQFFANGGTQALIVRVATGYQTAAWQLADGESLTVLAVTASSPGKWGDDLRLSVDRTDVRNPDADFNLVVSKVPADGGAPVVLETHRNLNLDSKSPQHAPSVVNGASSQVRVQRAGGLVFDQAGFAVSRQVQFPLTIVDRVIAGTVDGTPFRLTLADTPADMTDLVDAVNAAIADAGLGWALLGSETGPDGSAGTGSLRLEARTPGESSAVSIAGGAYGGLSAAIGMGLANGGREVTGAAQRRAAEVSNVAPAARGNDGSRAGPVELVGSESARSGMYALLDTDLFNLLVIPETFDMTDAQAASVIQAAVALCEGRRRAFYLIDPPASKTLDNVAGWINGTTQSRNAAVYFPAVRIADPLDGLRPRAMPASGTLAGVYARTDTTRGVWKAPAGTDATLNGVLDLTLTLDDQQNGLLNPKGVNALRSFPSYGRVAWGARTTKGADAQADEYKYVPVRRLALFLEESLYRGTHWVVFEPNDEPLWSQIRLNIGAFMHNLFRQGAFAGTTPRDAYFVKCDRETTTPTDQNLGIVNIVVGFAPLKPAEFVVIRIQQIAPARQA
jgi:phage tail sheath protein FI